MNVRHLLLCVTVLFAPALAAAQAPATPPPPPPAHEETFEASYLGTTGNATNNTFGLGADIIARPGTWLFRHKATFIRNESNSLLTAKAFDYTGRAQKTLNARVSAFGEYEFFRDRFAGIVPRNAVTGGVSLKAVATATQTLTVDLGAGYLNEHRLTGDNISSASYVFGTGYKAKLSEAADLTDDFRLTGIFADTGDWRIEHGIALTAKIAAGLSLKVSNTVRYVHQPPPGFKATDSITAIALVAKFAH